MAATISTSSSASGSSTTTIYNVPKISAGTVLSNGLNVIYFALGAVAIIVIIVAGILYISSAGNASQITRAKNALLYAIVGLVVVLLAFVITQFIAGRLGG